jgi:hypothetical protein
MGIVDVTRVKPRGTSTVLKEPEARDGTIWSVIPGAASR